MFVDEGGNMICLCRSRALIVCSLRHLHLFSYFIPGKQASCKYLLLTGRHVSDASPMSLDPGGMLSNPMWY